VPKILTAVTIRYDRGKTVVRGTERIGTVTVVHGGTVYVDPN
jgi:hypothetical protein